MGIGSTRILMIAAFSSRRLVSIASESIMQITVISAKVQHTQTHRTIHKSQHLSESLRLR